MPDGTPLGESFVAPLPDGYELGPWHKPKASITVIGDIKLLPQYWGRGLATEAMRKVVRWVFVRTSCDRFIVPPHSQNPAAERVYEKSGFLMYRPMEPARGHREMELRRRRYEQTRER
jgi:RimJ/RimL family protein N-acetyltransferase